MPLSTSYSYNKNGNIETLTREGIDNLTYTYKGNQLLSVDDQEGNEFQNNGFSDNGSFEPIEYVYDNNGNMNYDLNKNILDINYNYLNLPDNVSIIVNNDFNNILYQYDAIGSKRVKQTRVNGQIIKTTNYIGNFVYENGELAYILTSEGRIKYADSLTFYPKTKQSRNMVYQYFIKDHLGNTRIMFDEDGVKQSVNYYPFGMRTAEINQSIFDYNNTKYLYNGKELQDDFDLDWYDYGWRFYDAQLGRWHVVDALAESYFDLSPYNYVANNPLRYIDPDGTFIDDYFNKNGKYLGSDEAKTDNVKIINQRSWDDNKVVAEDGTESIDHEVGKANSTYNSKENLSKDAKLNVYRHYNPTDLDVVAHDKENKMAGMSFAYTRTKQRIKIKIIANIKAGLADHANEIISSFIHEQKHYSDFKDLGYDAYKAASGNRKESRAITVQMKHSSFKNTRKKEYQDKVIKYGRAKGMLFKIKPRGL